MLATAVRARALSWQVGGGEPKRARAVGSGGRTWRLTPPRGAAGRTVTVTAEGVAPGGGAATFSFALSR